MNISLNLVSPSILLYSWPAQLFLRISAKAKWLGLRSFAHNVLVFSFYFAPSLLSVWVALLPPFSVSHLQSLTKSSPILKPSCSPQRVALSTSSSSSLGSSLFLPSSSADTGLTCCVWGTQKLTFYPWKRSVLYCDGGFGSIKFECVMEGTVHLLGQNTRGRQLLESWGGAGGSLTLCRHWWVHMYLRLSIFQHDSFTGLLLSLTPVIKRLDFLKYQQLLAPLLNKAR